MGVLPSGWKFVTLRDLCQLVQYGYTASARSAPVGPKFLRITDIVPSSIAWESVPYCEIEDNRKARYLLQEGDIVIARTGATTGYAKSIRHNRESVFASYLVRVRLNRDVDYRYVGCIIDSDGYRRFISSQIGGTAQPNANAQILTSFPVPIPPLETQRKIAAILSTYDDLIGNNLRRIEILEEMAQLVYREWFVKFRFPGHENARFVGSPLGKIPEGWQIEDLFDLATVRYGKNLPIKKLIPEGDYPVYGAAKIIGRYSGYTRKDRTIITGCRGSVGEMQITQPESYVTNNSFTFDLKNESNFFWLYYTLRERGLRDVVGGAAQPQITLEGISAVQLICPTQELRKGFQDYAKNMFRLVWNLECQNHTLCQTRDLLLPKLISGKLDVSGLDINIGEEPA